ncbi:MAG: AmmeMemoRadiSam system radical SAM enzyme [Oscillospiraceae bacterium]|nr:AmmeMemoRadiSam system radical SAM enzyme [Oscillospiraceae bacterium]
MTAGPKQKEALFYKAPENENKVTECGLCPHLCRIQSGRTGLCGARRNTGGRLIAESYGRLTSVALDPIEKKPLNRFFPGSRILSVGSYGCNFRCAFCQNHSISTMTSGNFSGRAYLPGEIADISKECAEKGSIGVAYTYNEPLVGYEFVKDCAQAVKNRGQKNVLVTNGFANPGPFGQLLPLIDAFNIDLKGFGPAFYNELGGELECVKNNIEAAAAAGAHVELTVLVIPQKNDSVAEMEQISKWIAKLDDNIALHISRFFPAYKMRGAKPTPIETIYELAGIARKNLKYVYPGNAR